MQEVDGEGFATIIGGEWGRNCDEEVTVPVLAQRREGRRAKRRGESEEGREGAGAGTMDQRTTDQRTTDQRTKGPKDQRTGEEAEMMK